MSSRLECKNLTKDYGNVMALSDVNLTLESGRIVGLLGPNGSGKTTLIKLANGLLQPTSGEILLNGLKPGPETKAFVSYLPDANYLDHALENKVGVRKLAPKSSETLTFETTIEE